MQLAGGQDSQYQILRLLGQSRASQTYLAVDAAGSTCVVKQIKTDAMSLEPALSLEPMLQRLTASWHPQMPKSLDAYEQQGYLYWVQEYIAGESLAERLKLGCSVSEIWQVLEQTLPILDYLHRQARLHGDIRPENLICRAGLAELVLVDLAIAPTGSPEYAAPEQVQGQPVLASDLYSLGLSCLSLLTGLRPIEFWDAAANHWRDYWLPNATEPASERLAQFLDHLLAADPGQRFTASGAMTALARIRGQKLPVQTAAPGTRCLPVYGVSVPCLATLTGYQGISASVNAVAIQGSLLASASNHKSIQLWQLPTGAACGQLLGHTGAVRALAFHPQNAILASGGQDHSVRFWDCQTQQLIQTLTGHGSAVNAVAFSADGRLASGSSDKTLKLWRSGECAATLLGHRLAVNALAFSPDGRLASASADSTVRLWDTAGECLQILKGHTQAVRAVAFSPDGSTVASGGGTIRLWNLERNDCRLLSGHPWAISALLFSPDGQYLISASWDKTLKIWRVETGEQVCLLSGHTDSINAIALAGEFIASGSKDKTVKLWQTPEIITGSA